MRMNHPARATMRLACLAIFAVCLPSPALSQRGGSLRDSPQIVTAFREVVKSPSLGTVRVQCNDKDVALGTIVGADGLILTKASELKGNPKCKLHDGRSFSAKILGEDLNYDVALLKIDVKGLAAIEWTKSKAVEPGEWVASTGLGKDPVAIGVVSVRQRKLPPIHGYLGVILSMEDSGLRIQEISKKSGAEKAGLKPKDVIIEVEGKKLSNRGDLLGLLSRRLPGETLSVKIRRDEDEQELSVTLGERPKDMTRGDFQNNMGSKLSRRSTGFPFVLQHDTIIEPADCGGPLVNLDGKAIGINIARAGRTESYAIPSDYLPALIQKLKAMAVVAPKKKAG